MLCCPLSGPLADPRADPRCTTGHATHLEEKIDLTLDDTHRTNVDVGQGDQEESVQGLCVCWVSFDKCPRRLGFFPKGPARGFILGKRWTRRSRWFSWFSWWTGSKCSRYAPFVVYREPHTHEALWKQAHALKRFAQRHLLVKRQMDSLLHTLQPQQHLHSLQIWTQMVLIRLHLVDGLELSLVRIPGNRLLLPRNHSHHNSNNNQSKLQNQLAQSLQSLLRLLHHLLLLLSRPLDQLNSLGLSL